MLLSVSSTAVPHSQVLSADGTQPVGKISKQWSGLVKEYFTDADNFGIQCECSLSLNVVPF